MKIAELSIGAWFRACDGKKIGLLIKKADNYAEIVMFDDNLCLISTVGVPQSYEVDFIGYAYVKDSSLFSPVG